MTSGLRSQEPGLRRELFTPLEIQNGIMSCTQDLNAWHQALNTASRKAAELDRDYRVAQARAYLKPDEGTQEARKAQATMRTSDARFESHLATTDRDNALEKVRSLRAELQAWQSLAYLCRSEMQLAQ